MGRLSQLSGWIDRATGALGRGVSWLALVMVLIGAYNAIARYLGRFIGHELSSNAYIEAQWYLFSALFLLGAADTLRADGHVRVDVLYGRLSARGQATIDLAGTMLLLLPFCALCFWVALPSVEASWAIAEQSPDPGGLPRYPLKTLIPVAFALLGLQGLSVAAKALVQLVTGERSAPPSERGEATS